MFGKYNLNLKEGQLDVSVSLVFGGLPKMMFGDSTRRVVSDSLTSQGFEARPDPSSRL